MPRVSGCLFVLIGLALGCSNGNASIITSFSGSFIFDDDVQFFSFQSTTGGLVTVNTSSFSVGGFAPILALYDATGVFLTMADGTADQNCGIAGADVGDV